ncbi:MAG TPA: ABC transporter permease [Acidobacteriota bacterium]|nr:ABC transporter permease [Acidobacteriota bacterium]
MIFTIALRNVFRQKRRTVLTVLTMLGGFALSAIAIAWSDGSYSYIIDMFARNQLGHIQVHGQGYLDRPSLYKVIGDYDEVGAAIERVPGVEFWAPRVFCAGLAAVGNKSAGVRIIGIDPERESAATRFDRKVTSGRSFSPSAAGEAVLGEGLAKTLHAAIGDEVVVVSQAADGSIANDLYTIVGLVATGSNISDQSALYLHLHDAQELLVLEGRVHEIAVIGDDLDDVPDLASDIKAALGDNGLAVETWKEFAKSFYHAMKVDQQGSWIMVVIIVLVVAVGVLNTVLMTVLERTREYGVLRAIGTAPAQIFRLVLLEVLIMAAIAVVLGAALSYGVNYALSIHGITLPVSFTYGGVVFTKMFTEINARSFYIPGVSVVLSAILISMLPATKAARVAPARAMRTH